MIPIEGPPVAANPVPDSPWLVLVQKIQADDATGLEELYRVFSKGVRFHLWRHLGPQDVDDTLHDTFVIVAQAIRRGDLREPERLLGFLWTVVRRQVAARIHGCVHARGHAAAADSALKVGDHRPDPERAAILHQREELALRVLNEVSPRDREILVRFYLCEQTQEEICRDMNLTETQFRLLKSRAKARFGRLGRRKLAGPAAQPGQRLGW